MPVAASVPPWEDPVPAPVPAAQPAMAPSAPAGGYYEDSVPLDAYDDVVPYDDFDGYGYDGSFDAPQASPVPAPPAPVPPAIPQGMGAPAQDPGFQAAGAASAQPAMVPEQPVSANADDLSKMLSSSMGVNIVFEEV